MYTDSVQAVGDQAVSKVREQRRSLVGHLVRSALAGMYVAAAIVLIFSIGGSLSETARPAVPMIMGICFGGALTIVIFAGSELFTGSNLVLTLGVLTRKTRINDLLSNWGWTWIGNLVGSVLISVLVVRSGLFDAEPIRTFVLKLVEKKMNYGPEALLYRAILANWLVCLGVWMSARIQNEAARSDAKQRAPPTWDEFQSVHCAPWPAGSLEFPCGQRNRLPDRARQPGTDPAIPRLHRARHTPAVARSAYRAGWRDDARFVWY